MTNDKLFGIDFDANTGGIEFQKAPQNNGVNYSTSDYTTPQFTGQIDAVTIEKNKALQMAMLELALASVAAYIDQVEHGYPIVNELVPELSIKIYPGGIDVQNFDLANIALLYRALNVPMLYNLKQVRNSLTARQYELNFKMLEKAAKTR